MTNIWNVPLFTIILPCNILLLKQMKKLFAIYNPVHCFDGLRPRRSSFRHDI